MTQAELKKYIRVVADFPKPGIKFLDICSLLENPDIYAEAIAKMAADLQAIEFDKIVAIDARGFIPGTSLMQQFKKPLVLIRKAGKLPGEVITQTYDLEYGSASLEIQNNSIQAGDKIALVDDVLATGGTTKAACQLIESLQGQVVCISALIGLDYLPYQRVLNDYLIKTLLNYSR